MLGVIYILCLLIGILILLKHNYPQFEFKRLGHNQIKSSYHLFFNRILLSGNLEIESLNQIKLPPYKMYPELIYELLKLFLSYGFNLREQIFALRSYFKKDMEQEYKIKRIELSSALQFLVITAITWVMIFLTSYQAQLYFDLKVLLFIILWQFLGAALFIGIKVRLKQKAFKQINNLVMTICFWKVLLKVGVPSLEVFKRYPIDWQQNYPKELSILVARLEDIIKLTLRSGKPIGKELGYLFDETWYLYNEIAITYGKSLSKIRLVILALFFLPAYFVFVYFMLNNLAFTI